MAGGSTPTTVVYGMCKAVMRRSLQATRDRSETRHTVFGGTGPVLVGPTFYISGHVVPTSVFEKWIVSFLAVKNVHSIYLNYESAIHRYRVWQLHYFQSNK